MISAARKNKHDRRMEPGQKMFLSVRILQEQLQVNICAAGRKPVCDECTASLSSLPRGRAVRRSRQSGQTVHDCRYLRCQLELVLRASVPFHDVFCPLSGAWPSRPMPVLVGSDDAAQEDPGDGGQVPRVPDQTKHSLSQRTVGFRRI